MCCWYFVHHLSHCMWSWVSRGDSTARWYPGLFVGKDPESGCLLCKACLSSKNIPTMQRQAEHAGRQQFTPAGRTQSILHPGCLLLINLSHGNPAWDYSSPQGPLPWPTPPPLPQSRLHVWFGAVGFINLRLRLILHVDALGFRSIYIFYLT